MSVKQTPFSSILIANRGEIACRVMRTSKRLGLRTIAVYSDADADAPHVQMADDAFRLGPAPVGESYLVADKIIKASKKTGAEAIHPGYGFLSENAEFAKACAKAGLIFIGPDPDAIDLMGDKAKAKRRMIAADVPCVPGYQGEDQSDATLLSEADNVGFPIMVKAAAGGGGRGMRLVKNKGALADAVKAARSEAENAFGSGELILERAIIEPRHVEIQIFADRHGNVVHLGERDCSVQRRHQKVLEEAPCPVMTPQLREKMGDAAVKAARDINYVGAGTVEFLLDKSGAFYFLEMNTRLQVEHPVTEMVTDHDLVALQIHVAQGGALDFAQKDVRLKGHAIEARLYAEDTTQDFLPATGPVDFWRPASGDGIRVDSGIATGGEISPYYDPMIAKVVAHGETRDEARRKLSAALKNTAIFGAVTNRKFLIDALEQPAFVNGEATTAFIGEEFSADDLKAEPLSSEDASIAAVLLYISNSKAAHDRAVCVSPSLLNWSSASKIVTPYQFVDGDETVEVSVTATGVDDYRATCKGETYAISLQCMESNSATLTINSIRKSILFHMPGDNGSRVQISIDGRIHDLTNLNAVITSSTTTAGAGSVIAPMHGLLLDVFVKSGQKVTKGDRLAVLEAMKMQHELLADIDGEVSAVHFESGVQVAVNSLLFEITIEEK